MLTVVTQFRLFRFPIQKVVEAFGPSLVPTTDFIAMGQAEAIELQAYLRGEPTTEYLVAGAAFRLYNTYDRSEIGHIRPTVSYFSFRCTDGLYQTMYAPETLARHFINVQGFIETFKDEPMPIDYRSDLVEEAIQGILMDSEWPEVVDHTLLEPVKPILDILTFRSDLGYFAFDLRDMPPSFFYSLRLTTEEREALAQVREVFRREHEGAVTVRGLPDDWSRFLGPLSALPTPEPHALGALTTTFTFALYFTTIDPEVALSLLPLSASYLFYVWMVFGYWPSLLLLRASSLDDSTALSSVQSEWLSDQLLRIAMNPLDKDGVIFSNEDLSLILASAGIRDPMLKNEHMLGPYQIAYVPKLMEDTAQHIAASLAVNGPHNELEYYAMLQRYM